MKELHSSPDQRRMIAEINSAYKPALVVLDGLEAFVDGGPMTGTQGRPTSSWPGPTGWPSTRWPWPSSRSSGDRRHHEDGVFAQEQIARAAELGLGVSSAADIVIETPDAASEAYAEKIRRILSAG